MIAGNRGVILIIGFVLLLKCAEGTRYANFQHDWVKKMTESSYAYYEEAFIRMSCREQLPPHISLRSCLQARTAGAAAGEKEEKCPLYRNMWKPHIGAKNWLVGRAGGVITCLGH